MARRMRTKYFEDFLSGIRKRNRVNIIYRDASAKEVMAVLRKNEFIGMMPDQDMDSISGVFVDFFGKSAYTPSGPAVLNLVAKAPIVPCFIVRKSFGHEIVIEKPIDTVNSGNKQKDITENTQRYTKAIEDMIRKHPEQWVWFHRRWKTRPEDKIQE